MGELPLILTIAGTGFLVWLAFRIRRSIRRARLIASELSPELREQLERDFPRMLCLPPEMYRKLEGYTRFLMWEKNFEPCGSLKEVTDEMKALIAVQAAFLLIGLPQHRFYPELRSILVYPGAFRDHGRRRFGVHAEDERGTLLGESWETGSVILSWDSVVAGARNKDDGLNVTFHEFAHQLDQENGADGVPRLHDRAAYREWAEVFERNYEELVEAVDERGRDDTLIDPYGATNPAEFFAVVTETFFEESLDLREEHPDLYSALAGFYGLDPAAWDEGAD